MPKWTPEEVLELARRRRVLGGAEILSDEQVMQIACPNGDEPSAKLPGTAPSNAEDAGQMLVAAIAASNLKMIRECLMNGADPNRRCDERGATPLMLAIGYPHVKPEDMVGSLQILLEATADPNLVDSQNWTALHHSFRLKKPLAQDLLLSKGAVPARCDGGRCQKCFLSAKLARRRKPANESTLVREPARRAAEKKAAEKAAIAETEIG